jgi:hypothetical protein
MPATPIAAMLTYGGHPFYFKASDTHSPQATAFEEGSKKGHLTYVRCQIWSKGKKYLYASFANNNALAEHIAKHHTDPRTGNIADSFYELLRYYYSDALFTDGARIVTRLYFDLEAYDTAHTSGALPAAEIDMADAKLLQTLDIIAQVLTKMVGHEVQPRFAVMGNSRLTEDRGYKFSYHVIVTNVWTQDNLDDRVMQSVVETLKLTGTGDDGRGGVWVDQAVNTKNRNIRVAGPKTKGGPGMVPWYPRLGTPPSSRFTLAFEDSTRVLPLREILREILICWPENEANEVQGSVHLPPAHIARWACTTNVVSSSNTIEMTIDKPKKKIAKQSNPYNLDSPSQFVLKAPEDQRETAEKLLRFISEGAYSESLRWNRSGTLSFWVSLPDAVFFTYAFAGDPSHQCPHGVVHSGSSNRRRCLKVDATTGDIYTRCFKGSHSGSKCSAWTRIGDCNAFSQAAAPSLSCCFSAYVARPSLKKTPSSPSSQQGAAASPPADTVLCTRAPPQPAPNGKAGKRRSSAFEVANSEWEDGETTM